LAVRKRPIQTNDTEICQLHHQTEKVKKWNISNNHFRNKYNPDVDLGPYTFVIDDKYCGRIDFEVQSFIIPIDPNQVKNRRNQTLKCSIFHRLIDWNKVNLSLLLILVRNTL